eukprot:TRINITY_DN11299_c0_g1_i2.p1 TRINITY_DN11299_c0_g1~~TRINITY_DN11299_c0_g1_i2.p1  ORF type:complete len:333 (-),score=69.13 TRINITY_DN11299_c0_g1_i2:42-1040(-)
MSRRKPKNLFDSLGDLPTSGVGRVAPSDPSMLGKRPAPEPHHDPCVPKAKGKSLAKSVDDTDSLSKWLEDCLPPSPIQLSSSSRRKGSFGSLRDPIPSFGEGISGSPSLALLLGKSALLPSDMNLHSALPSHELVSTGVQHCLLGLQKWFTVSDRLEKFQKQVEDLEKELADSKAARRLAESDVAASSKAVKVAEAKATVALSRLTATEMEVEALRFRQAEVEDEMRKAMERSKDAQFEEVEALYLQQFEQIKLLVFKRGYDVGLEDAGVPEDSHLWAKYAVQSEEAPPSSPSVESAAQPQLGDVASPSGVVGGKDADLCEDSYRQDRHSRG